MNLLARFRSWSKWMLQGRRLESEMETELRFHIESHAADLVRAGLSQKEAMRQARIAFGGVESHKDAMRDSVGVRWWGEIRSDIRYGVGLLRRDPGVTGIAILTLALGVGANTAIFSIVNAVLLRSLPFSEPDRLVKIFFNTPGTGLHGIRFSVPELQDIESRAGVFENVSAACRGSIDLTGGPVAERLEQATVSAPYFSLLRATPQIGRLFGPEDAVPGYAPVVVISDSLWRRNFAADRNILGRTVRLDNDLYTIIGVMPPEFRHPGRAASADVDVWLTSGFSAAPDPPPTRGARSLPQAYGRLNPGLTIAQAQERLTAMAADVRRQYPADYPAEGKWTVEIQPLQEALVGDIRPVLLVVQSAVVLIVFIVSLNIANLLLARASGRQQEMAVRAAMGASRGRMVRQMLTESFVLSFIGAAAGIALAVVGLRFMLRFIPRGIPYINEITVDWTVLGFALLIWLLTALIFGVAPALYSTSSTGADRSIANRQGARGCGYSLKTGRLRDALILSELALAVVLMIGGGLLLRTLRDLVKENPGFNPTQVVAAGVNLPYPTDPKTDRYLTASQQSAFYRELRRRMHDIPGVEQAGFVSDLPAAGIPLNFALGIEGRPASSADDLRAEDILVSPDYFKVMQAALIGGRFFTDGDDDSKPRVAIIDEFTARRYWPEGDPLGRRIRVGSGRWMTVVGIVQVIKHDGLDVDGIPHVYVPLYQEFDAAPGVVFRDVSVVMRTCLPASVLEPQIRRQVQRVDPDLAVYGVASMNELLDRSLASRRFSADLVAGLAGLALLLASIGIYGLLAYMVSQRSREIGLRMALGAGRADILKAFLRKGLVLSMAGIGAGVAVSAAAAPMMGRLLYGVRPHDPAVFLIVPSLLFAVAIVASYIPARRATRVDPMVALREA